MSGRGSAVSVSSLTENQYRRIEDAAQLNDTIQNGLRAGTKYYEYTDAEGKIHKGETGAKTAGGIYRKEYSAQVASYSRMTTAQLEKEAERLQEISTANYQMFAVSAASRSASQVKAFSNADKRLNMIRQILRRRKNVT